jgi:ABC-type oligopeptide transport system substrate-binding subunit/ABC-type branched-subunit amino acid transport system substrate-binding protein
MMKAMKKLCALILMLCLCSCEPYGSLAKRRSEKAARAKGDIVIGIVDSSKMPSFFAEGVKLAIEEVNKEGGISGRRLRPLFYDDENSAAKGQKIAVKLSENTDVIAVIGHLYADVAISAAVTYEENGVIFIAPSTTDQDLIRETSTYTFRNIPLDEDIGEEMGGFVRRSGYKKMAILFDSESPGKRLAGIFHKYAVENGIEIPAEKSYSGTEEDYRLLIADLLKGEKFDALFLGGVLPSAANMIKQLRGMGLNVPIIGSELLDSPELWNIAGKAAEGTIISTVFDHKLPKNATRNFVRTFNAKIGSDPDTWAAQGYDAIRLLSYAIEKGVSTVPVVIGTTLRSLKDWQGVTGRYSFERDGNISGKAVFFKAVRNGRFEMSERDRHDDLDPFEVMEDTTLRLPVNDRISTIDPGLAEKSISIEIIGQLFMGLTEFDPKTHQPIPALASKWTVSRDGKTYRFDMRKDVTWTDGKPVTAHDIVWAVQRNIKPETKSPYAYTMSVLKNAEAVSKGLKDSSSVGVRAIDDFTVEFELEAPAVYFPAMAGLWVYRPLPRLMIEEYGDRWTEDKHIQSNGPYKLVKWEKGMVMILKKNPAYYEADKVSIPELRYYLVSEASSASLVMYKNNQTDIIGGVYSRISPSEIQDIIATPAFSSQYFNTPIFCTEAYGINVRCPPMDNPLVRKAISAAIDRRLLVQIAAKGSTPAGTYTPLHLFGYDADIGMRFDPIRAKQWLSEAGYPDGAGFPEITLLYNKSETHAATAKAVRLFLKHYLNINVKLDERDRSDYSVLKRQPYTPHLYRDSFCGGYPDPNSFLERFHFIRSENFIGWENKEFARLIDTAKSESDTEARKNLYYRAEQILCKEECVMIPIYFEAANYLINPRIKGWYSMPMGSQHIRDWYFEKSKD